MPMPMILMMLMMLTMMVSCQAEDKEEPEGTSIWWQRQRALQRRLGLFLLPRQATQQVRRHSRSYYAVMHRLARRGIQLHHDIQVGPGSLGDDFDMVYHPDTFGHSFERLPFLVFSNSSADAPKPNGLCRPHCSSEAQQMLRPDALARIESKLRLLNTRSVFPANVPLPSRTENLVRVGPRGTV